MPAKPAAKTPSKSPAKSRTASRPATPTRRTPRSSAGTGPKRLGTDDGWGMTSPSNWQSELVLNKETRDEELLKEREDYIKKENAKIDADETTSTSLMTKYTSVMSGKFQYPMSFLQNATIQAAGFAIGQQIKGEPASVPDLTKWACWGVMVVLLQLPYLGWLSNVKFSASPPVNGVLKALFNQAFFIQMMNALFLAYMKQTTDVDAMWSAIKDGMVGMAQLCLPYWLASDLLMIFVVPLKLQMLYCALSGLTFTVILAFMGVGN